MGRPADWSPLAGSDPVPGDPAGISAEAAHLSSVAAQIESQVAVLRKIAAGQSDEKGQHADKLKAAASDTADKLDKVTGRYRETAAALHAWVPELEYAQAQSLKALSQAQEAQGRQRASQPLQRPSGAKLTPADHTEDQARGKMLSQANSDMASAQAMLTAAVSHRDTAAAQTASRIRSATNADADPWYEGFVEVAEFLAAPYIYLAEHWVPIVKDLCTILEVLATVVAIVALFIPGLNFLDVLLLAAFGATLLAAVGRGVLAVTGNGSWLDFGLDVLALGTFGLTKLLSPALKTAAATAETVGKGLVEGERASMAAEYMTKILGTPVGHMIGEGRASELAMKWATQAVPDLAQASGKMGRWGQMGHAFMSGGGLGDYSNFAKLARVAARYGDNPEIAAAASKGASALTGLRTAAAFTWGGALAGPVGGGVEIDNLHNQSIFHPRLKIPGVSDLWDKAESNSTFEVPPQFILIGAAVAVGV